MPTSQPSLRGTLRVVLLGGAALITASPWGACSAQSSIFTMPNTFVHSPPMIDENHVELTSGSFAPPLPKASIGTPDSGLTDNFAGYGVPKSSDFIGGISNGGIDPCMTGQSPYCDVWADPTYDASRQPIPKDDSYVEVSMGSLHLSFQGGGGTYSNLDGTSETLTGGGSASPGCYTLTTSNGTIIEFCNPGVDLNATAKLAMLSKVTKPDGEIISYSYNRDQIPTNMDDSTIPASPPQYYEKLTGVSAYSSLGWVAGGQLLDGISTFQMFNMGHSTTPLVAYDASTYGLSTGFSEQKQTVGSTVVVRDRLTRGLRQTSPEGVIRIQQDTEERNKWYCYPGGGYILSSQSFDPGGCNLWWSQNYHYGMKEILLSGRTITATFVPPPNDFEFHFASGGCSSGNWMAGASCVQYVDRGGQRWTYAYGSNGITRTDPLGHTYTFNATGDDFHGGQLNSVTDELNRTTSYTHNSVGSLTGEYYPEGNHTTYDYNSRQDLLTASAYPKDGSAPLVTQYGYDDVCTNLKTCNKPNWMKDPKGNETDYTYYPEHGGIKTVTLPAAANGVRPQMRYYYTQLYPTDLNGHVGTSPVWRLTKTSTCKSSTDSCSGTADEQVTEYAYNDNNLMLTGTTVRAGDNSVSATTTYGYDLIGNRIWVDGPRTDIDDRSYTTYAVNRMPIFEIGVDPDGAGPLKRVIVHHKYDADWREIQTETGTGNATDGSDFVVSSFKRMTYDDAGRLVKTETVQP